jgi:hypothetical protein
MPFTRDEFLAIFAAYNRAVWPIQVVLLAIALASVAAVVRGRPDATRRALAGLAVLWLWMAVVYHWLFFTRINPMAWVFGGMFAAQAVLLAVAALRGPTHHVAPRIDRVLGLGLVGYALVIYPALGQLSDHPWPSAPSFGLPCPTTIFTLGVLLATSPRPRRRLVILPSVWAGVGSFAPFAFGVWEDLGLTVAAVLVVIRSLARR